MTSVSPKVLEEFKQFDSPTIFNGIAVMEGTPNEEYTDHTIRCLLPDLGTVVGYAVCSELTTNDPDSPAIPWSDYYQWLEGRDGPMIAVMKDVDSRPGRGASFGDGMAAMHKRLGVTGVVVDGVIRDQPGISRVGLPTWAWGTVPGHGVFNLVRFGESVTVGQLRVNTGDLILADSDGCVRIPVSDAADILRLAGEVREMEADVHGFFSSPEFTVAEMMRRAKS